MSDLSELQRRVYEKVGRTFQNSGSDVKKWFFGV